MKPAKAYVNILKLRLNRALRRKVITNYPVLAYIDPTMYCNLRCPACPTGLQSGLRPATAIDVSLFKAVIDEIGDYLFELHLYNWGEPLLHPQAPELIRYAKEKQIAVTLSTNFSIPLLDDYIERLVRSGLDELTVSLDGATQETYERYRRRGNIALVRKNMERVQEIKARLASPTPRVTWQFLVFRHNEHEIETVRAQYREWGADRVNIATPFMPDEASGEALEPSTNARFDLYAPEGRTFARVREGMRRSSPCSWLYGAVILNPNGKISPCCASPAEKDDFGEYAPSRGFMEVWNGARYRQARRGAPHAGRRPDEEKVLATMHRIDGSGIKASASLQPGSLICDSCPIVWWQNRTEETIDHIARWSARQFVATRDPRHLAALLLMGVPPAAVFSGLAKLRRFSARTARGISDSWQRVMQPHA